MHILTIDFSVVPPPACLSAARSLLANYLAVFKRGSQVARCAASTVKDGLVRRRSTKHPPPGQIFQRHRPHATITCNQHPQTYKHLCSPPLPSPLSESAPSSSIQPIDARSNPRFASHLLPIFTEQLACGYELRKVYCRSEAKIPGNSTKAKRGVYRVLS